jgi:hypothetical protein
MSAACPMLGWRDLGSEARQAMIEPGDEPPNLELPDQDGRTQKSMVEARVPFTCGRENPQTSTATICSPAWQ